MAGKFGRRPFRPLGLRLQRFSRRHILNYIAPTEPHGSDELPPSWKADSEASLNWGASENDAPPAAPAAPFEPLPAPEHPRQPSMPVQRTPAAPASKPSTPGLPPDLLRLMEIHEGRRERLKQEAEQRRAQRLADETATPKPPPLTQRHRASFEYVKPLAQDNQPTTPPEDDNAPDDWSDDDDIDDANAESAAQSELPSLTTPSIQPSRDEAAGVDDEASPGNPAQDTPPETFSPPFETAAPPAKREPGDFAPPVQRAMLDRTPSPLPPVTPQANVALPRESKRSEPTAPSQAPFDAAPSAPDQPTIQRGEAREGSLSSQPNIEGTSAISQPSVVRPAPAPVETPPSAPPVQRRETATVTPSAQPIRREREAAPTPPTIRRLPAQPNPPLPVAASPESTPQALQRLAEGEAATPLTGQGEPSASRPDVSTAGASSEPVGQNIELSSHRTIQRLPAKSLQRSSAPGSSPTGKSDSNAVNAPSRIEASGQAGEPQATAPAASVEAQNWQSSSRAEVGANDTRPTAAHEAQPAILQRATEPQSDPIAPAPTASPSRTQRAPMPPTVQRVMTPPEPTQTEQAGWHFAAEQSLITSAPPAQPPRPSTLPEMPVQRREVDAQREIKQEVPESPAGRPPSAASGEARVRRAVREAAERAAEARTETKTHDVPPDAAVQSPVQQAVQPASEQLVGVPPQPVSPESTVQRAPETVSGSRAAKTSPVIPTDAPIQREIRRASEPSPEMPRPLSEPVVQDIVPAWHSPVTPAAQAQPAVQRTYENAASDTQPSAENTSQRGNVQRVTAPMPDENHVAEAPPVPLISIEQAVREGSAMQSAEEVPTDAPASVPRQPELRRTAEPADAVPSEMKTQESVSDMPVPPAATLSQQTPAAIAQREAVTHETMTRTASRSQDVPQSPRLQTKQPTVQRIAAEPPQAARRAGTPSQPLQRETTAPAEAHPSAAPADITPIPVTPQAQPNIRRITTERAAADAVSQPSIQRQASSDAAVDKPAGHEDVLPQPVEPAQPPSANSAAPARMDTQPTIRRTTRIASAADSETITPLNAAPSPQVIPVDMQSAARPAETGRTIRHVEGVSDTGIETRRETTPTVERVSGIGEGSAAPRAQRSARTQTSSPAGQLQRSASQRTGEAVAPTNTSPAPISQSVSQEAGYLTRVVQREVSPAPTAARRVIFGGERGESAPAEPPFQQRGGESAAPGLQPSVSVQRRPVTPAAPVTPPSETRQPAPLNAFEAYERASVLSDVSTPTVRRVPLSDEPQSVHEEIETADADTMPQNLYEAMVSSGMVPISSMPQTAGESGVMRRAAPRDPRVSSAITELPASTRQAEQSVVPDANSTEAELLGLLGLPSDTPVVGLKPLPPAPAVQRAPAAPASESDAPRKPLPSSDTPAVQRAPTSAAPPSEPPAQREPLLSPAPPEVTSAPPVQVQRAIEETTAATQVESGDTAHQAEGEDVDIEKLAQQVFSILRQRLRIERERRDR